MSGYVWDLSGTDKQCASYGPGHLIHWIHFNHSMREPSVVIPVTAVVDDDGLVRIEGDDLGPRQRPPVQRLASRAITLTAVMAHAGQDLLCGQCQHAAAGAPECRR
jgi:hypothetical protein